VRINPSPGEPEEKEDDDDAGSEQGRKRVKGSGLQAIPGGDRGSLVLTVKIGKGEGITEGMGGFQVNPAADARPVS
jgi:hypothetical protein